MTGSGPITFHIPRRLRFASPLTPNEGVRTKPLAPSRRTLSAVSQAVSVTATADL